MKKRVLIMVLVLALTFLSACSLVSVKTGRSLAPFLVPTEGAKVESDGGISLTTDLEENRFTHVVLQIYKDNPKEHLLDLVKATEGKTSGVYTHEMETGSYIITLKANSNKHDEGIDMRVFLTKGNKYIYSFIIKDFSENAILIQDFAFGME